MQLGSGELFIRYGGGIVFIYTIVPLCNGGSMVKNHTCNLGLENVNHMESVSAMPAVIRRRF